MSDGSMIELDLDHDSATSDAPLGPGVWWRQSRYLALATSVVLIGVLAGSVPARPLVGETAVLRPQAGAATLLTDNRLFTAAARRGSTEPVISAHDLSGRTLWQTSSDFSGGLDLQTAGSMVLVTGAARGGGAAQTVALDAASGEVRWSLVAQVRVSADTALGWATDSIFPVEGETRGLRFAPGKDGPGGTDAVVYDLGSPTRTTLRAIDLVGGRELWSADFGGDARIFQPDQRAPDELVVASRAGIELRELRTGKIRVSRPADTEDPILTAIPVVDGPVLVQRFAPGGGAITAFDPGTLRPIWTVPLRGDSLVETCGNLPCYRTTEATVVLDPGTGAPIWRTTPSELSWQGGHLLQSPFGEESALRTLDPGGGGGVIDLAGWEQIPASANAAPPLLTRAIDGRVWLAALPPGARAPRMLGTLSSKILDCQSAGSSIACRTAIDEVRVWQLRAGYAV